MARTRRWVLAVVAATAVFVLTWQGLTVIWHWSRGDAFGLAAAPFAVVLAVFGWWAALPLGVDRGAGVDSHGVVGRPGSRSDPVRFGAIPIALRVAEPREDLLFQLRQVPRGSLVTVLCAVTGLRGVGKSQIAAEYARERIDTGWTLVAWVDSEDSGQMLGQLVALAERLDLRRSDDEDVTTVAARLRDWLQARTEPGLLVFDNAVDPDVLAAHLPATGTTQVVITSTEQAFSAVGEVIHVPEFTPEQATDFLQRATGIEDQEGADALGDELGRLPLALAHAAALITEQHLDYPTYLKRLRDVPLTDYLIRPVGHPYPRGTVPAILLSLAAVERDDPTSPCRRVVDLLAVLAPTGIARDLLYQVINGDEAVGPMDDEDRHLKFSAESQMRTVTDLPSTAQVDAAIGLLARASLVGLSEDGIRVISHRLVMRIVRERAQAEHRIALITDVAIRLINNCLAAVSETAWANRIAITELVSHATALWEHTRMPMSAELETDEPLKSRLLSLRVRGLTYLQKIQDFARAISLGTELLITCQNTWGSDHPETLQTCNNLAYAYRATGRLDKAITLFELTVAARERVLGHAHADTLRSKSYLAGTYREAGRLDEAITLHEQTLTVREQVLGPDHPDTLQSTNDLAYAYRKAGRLNEAIMLFERTLEARQRVLGHSHPGTLQSRSNLASAYREAGRLDEAIALHEQTLTTREQVLGPDHPDTLRSRNNVAGGYREAGRMEEAIAMQEKTLAARERVLGHDHPDVLQSRSYLGVAYRSAGRLDEAIILHEQAMAAYTRVLGLNHPDTLRSCSNLAASYRKAGRLDEAIRLSEQTRATRARVFGPDHRETLHSRHNLAITYREAGRLNEAIALFEQTLTTREQLLGPDHPDTLRSRCELANIYRPTDRPTKVPGMPPGTG
jgi:tetratricopeptide (TPR) repeat protein